MVLEDPSVPSIRPIHKDPSSQGYLWAIRDITNINHIVQQRKNNHLLYLCFRGNQESLDVHLFQEYRENPLGRGYQEPLSAHRHLQATTGNNCSYRLETVRLNTIDFDKLN